MAESSDIMQLCRLCLAGKQVNVPIFAQVVDDRQTYRKISTCLPVKVSVNDNLPKSVCDKCYTKLDTVYQFWNTSLASEKQLLELTNLNCFKQITEPEVILKQEVVDYDEMDNEVSNVETNFFLGPGENSTTEIPNPLAAVADEETTRTVQNKCKTSYTNIEFDLPPIKISKSKQAEAPRQQTDKSETPASVAVPPLILHAENNKTACAEPMDITKNEEGSGTKETTIKYHTSTQQILKFLKNPLTHSENQKITEKLLNMFIGHFQPFSLVEEKSFVNFVEALNPSYQIPSRHTISKELVPAKYEATLNSIKEIIPDVRKLCLTTDNWTSANNDSFLAVTAHYISQDFIFKSVMLQCVHMTGSNTSSNLASELQKIITEWGLNSRITMVISDNAASMKKAISEELHLKHFGCFAHTINLVVNDGLSGVMPLIDKIKTIVAFFKRSSTGWENLQFQQTRINPDTAPKKLIQSVSTRWNSIYYMLERFNELDEAIKSTLALIKHSLPLLSSDDWEVIHELLEVLKPFEEVTKAILGQNYPTASLVIVYFNGLNDVCTKLTKKAFHGIVTTVVEKLISSLRERLGTIEHNRILSMSTFLDPRYKYHAFVDDSAAENAKNEVVNAVCSHLLPTEIRDNSVNKEIVKYTENEFSVWNFLSKTVLSSAPQRTVTSRALLEVQRYMEENIVPFSADPIEWWQSNRFNYPHLSLVVQNYFCCLATSVPCERLFSKAGALLHERRTRLSRRLTQQLLYLNSNQNYIPT